MKTENGRIGLGRAGARLAAACLAAALLAAHAWPPVVRAQQQGPTFVFILPPGQETSFDDFLSLYTNELLVAHEFFTRLYEVTPPTPIYVRVYADRATFEDLNVLVPPLAEGAYHSHLGAREVSLILPFPPGFLTSRESINVIRHELNGVFLSALSANNLPAGLELGINQYVEYPGAQVQAAVARLEDAYAEGALLSWRELFDSPAVYSDRQVAYPQAWSVAAFLIDRYGYPSIIQLARTLAQGRTLAAAFNEVFGLPLDRLELDWRSDLPAFLEGRWRTNALFNFDLAPFEAALQNGAYGQVAAGLSAVLPFLEVTGQLDAYEQAQAMIERGRRGEAAAELVLGARAALQLGDYETTLDLVARAREAYAALGGNPREAELAGYEARATEVLDLRAQLEAATARLQAGDTTAEADLLALAPRFQALGDAASLSAVESTLQGLYQQRLALAADRQTRAQQSLYVFGAALALAALHQAWLLARRLRRRDEEAVV